MKAYGLIGQPLQHSFSPQIHAMLGDYDYRLYPLGEEELAAFVRDGPLAGFNVTIPYKQKVMAFLDVISPMAQAIGAVNTVARRADGTLFGDNTDAYGFERMLGATASLQGAKALVLGSGGAGKTAAAVLKAKGLQAVIISRKGENNYGNLDRHQDAKVVVNATPVGMYPETDQAPLDLGQLPRCQLVLDMVYNPQRTRLLLQAEASGIPHQNGLTMLAAQAQKASVLWGLLSPEEDRAEIIADSIRRQMTNIVLIGMPGCGKTAVGRLLSRLTQRPFYDTDEMLAEEAGMPTGQLLVERGEPAFRVLEAKVLAQAARESGGVIATGGGVVTQPHNQALLRQNSTVVYLRRELSLLPLHGRPLSQGRGVEQLFEQRRPLYEGWADLTVDNVTLQAAAQAIMEELL